MTLTTATIGAWVASFVWPFARFGAMFMVAPFFGARSVPVRIRVCLAALLALLVAPTLPVSAIDPMSSDGLVAFILQLLAGALLGFIMQIVFAALSIAGQVLATTMGLGFASTVDPQNGQQSATLGQLYSLFGILIFLALDCHLALIQVLADSFRILPADATAISAATIREVVSWSGSMFATGLRLVLPAVFGVLMVNLALGIITRAAPQLNIFSVGFPLTIISGLIFIVLTLGSLDPVLREWLLQGLDLASAIGGQ